MNITKSLTHFNPVAGISQQDERKKKKKKKKKKRKRASLALYVSRWETRWQKRSETKQMVPMACGKLCEKLGM